MSGLTSLINLNPGAYPQPNWRILHDYSVQNDFCALRPILRETMHWSVPYPEQARELAAKVEGWLNTLESIQSAFNQNPEASAEEFMQRAVTYDKAQGHWWAKDSTDEELTRLYASDVKEYKERMAYNQVTIDLMKRALPVLRQYAAGIVDQTSS